MKQKTTGKEQNIFSDQAAIIDALQKRLAAAEAVISSLLTQRLKDIDDPKEFSGKLIDQMQDASVETENRYRRLLNNMSALIFELDPEGRILFANPAVFTQTGYTIDELYGSAWWKTLFTDELQAQIPEIQSKLKQGDIKNYQITILTKAGDRRVLSMSSANEYNPDGRLKKIVAIATDVTQQHQANQRLSQINEELEAKIAERTAELRLINQRLQAVLKTQPAAIWIADANGKIVEKNHMADVLWGGVAPMVDRIEQYQTYRGWFTDSGRELDAEDWGLARALLYGETSIGQRIDFLRFDGTHGTMLNSAAPIYDGQGELMGAVAVSIDITHERELERQAQASAAEAERRAAEAEESKRTLEALMEFIPLGITIAEAPNVHLRMTSRYGEELLGHNFSDLKEASVEDYHQLFQVYHPETGKLARPEELPLVRATTLGEEIHNEECVMRRKDGSEVTVLSSAGPILDVEGEIIGGIIAWQDIDEIKKTEEALQLSEKRLRRLIESNMIGIMFAREDGEIYEANDAFLNLVGYSRKDLDTGNLLWKDMTPSEYAELDMKSVEDAKQKGACTPYEKEYTCKDGRRVPILIGYALLDEGEGEFISFVLDLSERNKVEAALRQARAELEERVQERTQELAGVVQELRSEIEERKRAEAALDAARIMFERLFESSPDAMVLINRQGRILRANKQTLNKFNYSLQELLGLSIDNLLPVRFREQHERLRQEYFAQPQTRPMGLGLDLYAMRKDGSEFPADVTLSPLEIDDNVMIICLIHDITPRKQIEEALRESETRFRALFEQSPLGVHLLDIDGVSLQTNAMLQEMLGYGEDELRQMNYLEYTYPEDRQNSGELFERLITKEQSRFSIEKRYIRKDGTLVWARMTAALIRDEHGKPLFIMKLVENTTSRKQMEAELNEVRRCLMDSVEAERLLLAQELHDGPMQELYALNYRLAALKSSTQEEKVAAELEAAQSKLNQINHTLRATARDLRPPTLAPFGLEKAIQEHAHRAIKNHPEPIQLRMDLKPDGKILPERVRLTMFRIYQVALNNVLRHAQASELVILFDYNEQDFILEVRDDGVGFLLPERWIELAREGHLGLVGAQERVESIGGRLEIHTQPGDGTQLKVVVPRSRIQAQ